MSSKARILLVDDDPSLLRLLSLRLHAAGYETFTAENGRSALAQLSSTRPHLVITDLQMDGMDGLTLFKYIQQENPALPVIVLTAHGSIEDAVTATHEGVFGFLTKPFDAQVLLNHVDRAVGISGAKTSDGGDDESWRSEFLTRSPVIEELLSQARLLARSDASLLIHGESGTGKEVLARAIHQASDRADKPFLAVNCGAIPESLLESELFGHLRGAFTGATNDREGLFRAANGGTLFLDEIGDIPMPMQVKLLRVLQERQVRPVGSTRAEEVDVRIISATHRDLMECIAEGDFREDLYYRLNVVTLEIPNLDQRREDIPLLANHFLSQMAERNAKKVTSFAPGAMEILVGAPWPGNVRQLLNVVEQAVTLSTTPVVSAELVRAALHGTDEEIVPFADAKRRFEQAYLARVLKITNGNVAQAARLAKRNRTEFYKLMQRHHLNPADFRAGSASSS